MTKTDPATLPQYLGRPVPWVTRWSHEPIIQPYGVQPTRAGLRLTYGEPNEFRDDHDVLWQKEGLARGGVPQWARVSTYRQRSAMLKRRCQVCGKKIDERPIRWLMPIDGLEEIGDGRMITMQPPTCSGCIDLSLQLCPNLPKYGYMILKVLDYSIWGVYGESLFAPAAFEGDDGLPMNESRPAPMGLRRIQAPIGYADDYGANQLGLTLAKQQVVELGKYVVEVMHHGKERPNNFEGVPQGVEAFASADALRDWLDG